MIREKVRDLPSGYAMIVVLLAVQIILGYATFVAIRAQSVWGTIAAILATILS